FFTRWRSDVFVRHKVATVAPGVSPAIPCSGGCVIRKSPARAKAATAVQRGQKGARSHIWAARKYQKIWQLWHGKGSFYCSMKRYPSTPRRSAIIRLFGRVWLEWLLVTFWLFTPQLVFGTDRHWNGNTDTTWGTSTNWDTGVPNGNTDNAVFDTTFTAG